MSYCRFSSDDFKCDVYVYESIEGGFRIHVSSKRVLGDIPKSAHLLHPETMDEFFKAHKKQMKFLQTAKRAAIGLPHDGADFLEPTAKDAALTLKTLKGLGYHVPDYAIEALLAE